MRIPVFVLGVLLAGAAPAAGQVHVNLASTGSLSATVDPGDVTVVLDNRLPLVRYTITVVKEAIPIAALSADAIAGSGLVPSVAERSGDPCDALAAATLALEQAVSEAEVATRGPVLRGLLDPPACSDPAAVARASALLAGTSHTLGPYTLRRGERLIVTVTRPAADDQTATWTVTLSTEPRGEWITMYGAGLFPNLDEKFVTRAAEEGFEIVDADSGWSLQTPAPSVFFTWLSSRQRHRNWSWGPAVGLGVGGSTPAIFGGVGLTFNQNISLVLGAAVTGQQRLRGQYRDEAHRMVAEVLTDEQLHETAYRPKPFVGLALRFDRNPFKDDDPPPAAPTPPNPAPARAPGTPAPGETPAPAGPGEPEAARDADIKLHFDAKGAPHDPAALADLVRRAEAATDVFIISHGWWNDESTADCFYRRMIGGLAAATPEYLTGDRYMPLFVTIYWPSALFPMEPGDCAAPGRQESSAAPGARPFTTERVTMWAAAAFPDAARQPSFPQEVTRAAALLERERSGSLTDAEGAELAATFFRWRAATDAPGGQPDGPEPEAFAGSAADAAARWQGGRGGRGEAFPVSLIPGKKWLNFGNAFTFWTMKDRAGTVGARGVYEVLRALQPLRARPGATRVRVHLIGHSFGGKLVTASLTGEGTAAPNRADSLTILQGAFSHFAFASRDEIRAASVSVDREGRYRGVLASSLVEAPIVVTHSSADLPNRLLYPAGVAIVNDVTESARAPRFGALGANGVKGAPSAVLDLATGGLEEVLAAAPKVISVDASRVILGHSDLAKERVFRLIWEIVEHGR
jgi:hypothetical protein